MNATTRCFFRFSATLLITISVVLSLSACDPEEISPPSASTEQPQDNEPSITSDGVQELTSKPTREKNTSIHWYKGSLEQAFADAKELKKPLFLYWGAIWCPPCEEIKQTVFKSPNFIAQTELFIPVYLDGDTDRAQHWGDQFSVKGYPTMIVFNPSGEEVTRIPGGIDLDRYNTVLALTLNGLKKTLSLIDKASLTPEKLSAGDYTQIAFYSWDQSNLNIANADIAELLEKLSADAELKHNSLAASRLFLQSLVQRIENNEILSNEKADDAYQKLITILNSQSLVIANLDFSMFWSEEIATLTTKPGTDRVNLEILWTKSMESIRFDDSLSKAQQLGTWYPQLFLFWLNNPTAIQLPETVKNQVTQHINELDLSTSGSARQTVINKAYQVLLAAHLNELSKNILLAEIEKSSDPYYFMTSLAGLEEDEGNINESIDWLAKAYEVSTGNATRFQWGVEYVTGMMRMRPDDIEKISTSTQELITNLKRPIDILSGRNFSRLETLNDSMKEWETTKERKSALKDFHNTIISLCHSAVPASQAETNCKKIAL